MKGIINLVAGLSLLVFLLTASAASAFQEQKTAISTVDSTNIKRLLDYSVANGSANPKQARDSAELAYAISKSEGLPKYQMQALQYIAYSFIYQGKFDSAEAFLQSSLDISMGLPDSVNMVKTLSTLGKVYFYQYDFPKAFNKFEETLRLAKVLGEKSLESGAYKSIGNIYDYRSQFEDAILNYEKALEIAREINDEAQIGSIYSGLGISYYKLEDYARSVEFYNKAIEIKEQQNDMAGIAKVLNNLANVYLRQEAMQEAVNTYKRSIAIKLQIGNVPGAVQSAANVGEVFLKTGQFNSIIDILSPYKTYLDTTSSINPKRQVYNVLARTYDTLGLNREAKDHYKEYVRLNSRHYNERNDALTAELKESYEIKEKEIENLKLIKANENAQAQLAAKDAEIALQRVIGGTVGFGFLLLLVVAASIYYGLRQKKKAIKLIEEKKRVIEEQNKELLAKNSTINQQKDVLESQSNKLAHLNDFKARILSIAAHDFRSPLNSIKATLTLLELGSLSQDEMKGLTKELSSKVETTSLFLDNLLRWSKTQMEGLKLNKTKIDMHLLAKNNLKLLGGIARTKQIELVNKIAEDASAFADLETIKLVIRNLVSNALKFTGKGGRVLLEAKQRKGVLIVSVADNGMGIEGKVQQKLFQNSDYSQEGTANELGTGLGLVLCKEFVEANGGTIWLESKVGEGSTFFFSVDAYQAGQHPDKREESTQIGSKSM